MTRKSTQRKHVGSHSRNGRIEFRGFINVNPRQQDKKAVKDLVEKSTESTIIAELCEGQGLKLAIKWLVDERAYNATLYDGNPDSPNAGLLLSAIHVDALTACCILHHYHMTLCDAGDWEEHSPDRDVDW